MKLLPVSALSSWVRCPRQFYLNYVLEVEEPPKDVMILGLLKHKLHEKISQEEQKIIISLKPTDNLKEVFHSQFTSILKNLVTAQANALRMVKVPLTTAFQKALPIIGFEAAERAERLGPLLAQNITGEELWHALTPKIKPEYSVQSQKLGLKGRIDRLELHATGLVPVELKSGNPPTEGVWEEHKVQAASYALMLEDHFGTTVPEAIVHYVDHNSRRPVILNPFIKEQIPELVIKVRSCLETQELPDGCGKEYCKACKDPLFEKKHL